MKLRAPVTLETRRLILRRFTPDDVDVHARILSDPLVTRYLPRGPYPPGEARGVSSRTLSYFIEHWKRHGFGVWAVVDKQSNTLIGQCGLNNLQESPEVEVLYLLDRPHWGAGLATEGAQAALSCGFDTINLQRIIALTMPKNIASQRVLEKIGLRYEKDAFFFGINVCYFAIDRESYRGSRAQPMV